MLKTILVPLDGLALADQAVPYATELARASGARLLLVHAAPGTPSGRADLEAQARAVLTSTAERLRASHLEVDWHVCHQDAASAIVSLAHREHVDLIVMATHGRSGVAQLLDRSIADEVLRRAEAPILLVSADSRNAWPTDGPRRIMVTLDGEEFAEAALEPASGLAKVLGAELLLFCAIDSVSSILGTTVDEKVLGALDYLEQVATELRAQGRAVSTQIGGGHPATAIAAAAHEHGAGIVAMATHARWGLRRLLLGSVAAGVLPRVMLPLLLTRRQAVDAGQEKQDPAWPSSSGIDARNRQRLPAS
ncbi:MAG: universal stress protein [Chloroflexi bacterium]|nr:universal stress protein [Chloroflexota bacterium]